MNLLFASDLSYLIELISNQPDSDEEEDKKISDGDDEHQTKRVDTEDVRFELDMQIIRTASAIAKLEHLLNTMAAMEEAALQTYSIDSHTLDGVRHVILYLSIANRCTFFLFCSTCTTNNRTAIWGKRWRSHQTPSRESRHHHTCSSQKTQTKGRRVSHTQAAVYRRQEGLFSFLWLVIATFV
jgi:hypothetical protein